MIEMRKKDIERFESLEEDIKHSKEKGAYEEYIQRRNLLYEDLGILETIKTKNMIDSDNVEWSLRDNLNGVFSDTLRKMYLLVREDYSTSEYAIYMRLKLLYQILEEDLPEWL